MKILFNEMNDTVLEHFQGGDGQFVAKMFNDGKCKILRGLLAPGCSIGLHTHENDSETIYILSGTGKVLCDGVYEALSAGSCHYCPKGHEHSLINDSEEDLTFFAIVPVHEKI